MNGGAEPSNEELASGVRSLLTDRPLNELSYDKVHQFLRARFVRPLRGQEGLVRQEVDAQLAWQIYDQIKDLVAHKATVMPPKKLLLDTGAVCPGGADSLFGGEAATAALLREVVTGGQVAGLLAADGFGGGIGTRRSEMDMMSMIAPISGSSSPPRHHSLVRQRPDDGRDTSSHGRSSSSSGAPSFSHRQGHTHARGVSVGSVGSGTGIEPVLLRAGTNTKLDWESGENGGVGDGGPGHGLTSGHRRGSSTGRGALSGATPLNDVIAQRVRELQRTVRDGDEANLSPWVSDVLCLGGSSMSHRGGEGGAGLKSSGGGGEGGVDEDLCCITDGKRSTFWTTTGLLPQSLCCQFDAAVWIKRLVIESSGVQKLGYRCTPARLGPQDSRSDLSYGLGEGEEGDEEETETDEEARRRRRASGGSRRRSGGAAGAAQWRELSVVEVPHAVSGCVQLTTVELEAPPAASVELTVLEGYADFVVIYNVSFKGFLLVEQQEQT